MRSSNGTNTLKQCQANCFHATNKKVKGRLHTESSPAKLESEVYTFAVVALMITMVLLSTVTLVTQYCFHAISKNVKGRLQMESSPARLVSVLGAFAVVAAVIAMVLTSIDTPVTPAAAAAASMMVFQLVVVKALTFA